MPSIFLKTLKLNLSKYSAEALAYAEGMARRWAEQEIGKILDKLRTACPPPATLAKMNKILDRISSLTTSATRRAARIKKLLKTLDILIAIFKVVIQLMSKIPLGSAIGGPGLVGLIFAFPQGFLAKNAAKLKWFTESLEAVENEKKNISLLLRNFDLVFVPILAKVQIIRTLLNRCAENPKLTAEERAKILEGAIIETDIDEDYKSQSGTVYKIKIVTNPESPSIAPQRQAVAFDARGIAVLKGPLSFAGDSEVLKQELKFRIDNQLP